MMENMKKKEWVKLLGAFVVGALLMLAVTGAGGALWQGKLTAPPFTVEESVVTVGCGTTNCELSTQLGNVSSTLSGGISDIENHYFPTLSDQISNTSTALVGIIGRSSYYPNLSDQLSATSQALRTLMLEICR